MNIGFIGLGNIGAPMARRLASAGHALVVNDRRREQGEPLLALGAAWGDTPRQVAERSEVVFTSLPGPNEVDAVALGEAGIYAGARPGCAHFDLTSNWPDAIRRLSAEGLRREISVLDAPVSGGVPGAEAGTLSVMVGGDAAVFARYEDVLRVIGENVFHVGDVGMGCTLKLVNNLLSIGTDALVQEAFILAAKAGLDPAVAYQVILASSGKHAVQRFPRLMAREFHKPTFTLELASKDVGLAVQLGQQLGVSVPIATSIDQVLQRAMAAGLGPLASYASLLMLEEASGVRLEAAAQDSPPA